MIPIMTFGKGQDYGDTKKISGCQWQGCGGEMNPKNREDF